MTTPATPGMFENDPFGGVKKEQRANKLPARDVNAIHTNSDVDVSPTAQHHTLGLQRNQAATGSHNHGGKDSQKLGAGLGISISGSRGGNAALLSLINALKQVMALTDNTTP